ncbi:nucleotidyltransferase family protein [Sphingosinicella rhizophila]|uniref:NTP transferase domain-containing protein n=1 Tax=Sphingosinicella rhizophila TaxID=3050082 RepID=A0ABU3Q5W5_9SPHN|nr:NTP transferase domain-containing protein [Sphingosinicella sp. GR2756]MDT9598803.1 NTP transferase domain-containing protein [Sphingosinicella sp. GR2756]
MIALEKTIAILLCAGLSRRFGDEDKLAASFDEKPLVAHAADMLASLPFQALIAVLPGGQGQTQLHAMLTARGFRIAENPRPSDGKDSSIRAGLQMALRYRPKAMLIALGDMPFVTSDHVARLSRAVTPVAAAMSFTSGRRSPPLIVPVGMAEAITSRGDVPVRDIVTAKCLVEVSASERELADLDTAQDFAAYRAGERDS